MRAVLAIILILSVGFVVQAGVEGAEHAEGGIDQRQINGSVDGRLAITAHGDAAKSKIIVYGEDGNVQYVNSTYDRYFDVDPVPGTRGSVTYTAAMHVYGAPCSVDGKCSRNVIERLNVSTGQTTVLYERYRPGINSNRWHDADRIDDHRWVVGDITRDQVYIVNTSTGVTEWTWSAQSEFPLTGGGSYPGDWTHVNDVEVLSDGRIAASLRNQDTVVFLDPQSGLVSNWSLGSNDDHSVLYEQHNPDYIPAERGGPALIVADSQNHRLVEYQRKGGTWERTWVWDDGELPWPRDADRLPNGHTLVVGSNSHRVFEIDETGTVQWTVDVDTPYDAELLDSGDESAGGRSASALGLKSVDRSGGDVERTKEYRGSILRQGLLFLRSLLPPVLVNGILYVLPPWVHFAELGAIGVAGLTTVVWGVIEYRWSTTTIEIQAPLRLSR